MLLSVEHDAPDQREQRSGGNHRRNTETFEEVTHFSGLLAFFVFLLVCVDLVRIVARLDA